MQEAAEMNLSVVETVDAENFENEDAVLWQEFDMALDYAVSSGFCPADQAEDWREGYLACGDRLDWKRNLLRVLTEKCMPKGEELQDDAEEILQSPYLTIDYKLRLERSLASANSYEKEGLLKAARKEIAAKKKQEDEFNRLLFKIQLAEAKQQYEKDFAKADSVEAKKILDRLSRQQLQRSSFEVVRPDVSQELELVKQNLEMDNISEAKRILNSVGATLNFSGEYTKFSRLIDVKEIELTRRRLLAMQAA